VEARAFQRYFGATIQQEFGLWHPTFVVHVRVSAGAHRHAARQCMGATVVAAARLYRRYRADLAGAGHRFVSAGSHVAETSADPSSTPAPDRVLRRWSSTASSAASTRGWLTGLSSGDGSRIIARRVSATCAHRCRPTRRRPAKPMRMLVCSTICGLGARLLWLAPRARSRLSLPRARSCWYRAPGRCLCNSRIATAHRRTRRTEPGRAARPVGARNSASGQAARS